MYTHTYFVTLLAAVAQARFGQEQGNGAIQGITDLGDLGKPGDAPTLGGNGIQFLLAAANPCDKLKHGDKIIETLGDSDRAVEAARRYVAAEQNFNVLRGVVPLVDPAVTGQDVENKNSETSIKTPFNADGLSVADVAKAQGFDNFDVAGGAGTQAASSEGKGGGAGGGQGGGARGGAGGGAGGGGGGGVGGGQGGGAGGGSGGNQGGGQGGGQKSQDNSNKDNKDGKDN